MSQGVKVQLVERDNGFERAMKATLELGELAALVGIFEGSVMGMFGKDVPPSKIDYPIALYGGLHEFGSDGGKVPEKAWMRKGLDKNRADYDRLRASLLAMVQDGRLTPEKALQSLGVRAQKDIRESVEFVNWTNSKGEPVSGLVDTTALRNSIQVEVRKGERVVIGRTR